MAESGPRATVLLVGDERSGVGTLRDLLSAEFSLLLATDGPQALELSAKKRPDLVLCELTAPRLEGLIVCERFHQAVPALPVALVTLLPEDEHEVAAFAAGAVDYVRMPVSSSVLAARVRAHIGAARAAAGGRVSDAPTAASGTAKLEAVVRMLSNVIECRNARLSNYASRVARLSAKMAAELKLSEARCADVYRAGLLHELGKIGFPDELMDKPLAAMTEDEMLVFKEYPAIAEKMLLPIVELASVSNLIAQQNERIDGLGYPEGLSGDDVPIGVCILSAARLYFDLITGRRGLDQLSMAAALVATRNEVGRRYPRAVMDVLERAVVSEEEENLKPLELDAADLEPGMILARDWRTNQGVLLLASGLVLTDAIVRQIRGVALKRGTPIVLRIAPVDSRGRVIQKSDSTGENAVVY